MEEIPTNGDGKKFQDCVFCAIFAAQLRSESSSWKIKPLILSRCLRCYALQCTLQVWIFSYMRIPMKIISWLSIRTLTLRSQVIPIPRVLFTPFTFCRIIQPTVSLQLFTLRIVPCSLHGCIPDLSKLIIFNIHIIALFCDLLPSINSGLPSFFWRYFRYETIFLLRWNYTFNFRSKCVSILLMVSLVWYASNELPLIAGDYK